LDEKSFNGIKRGDAANCVTLFAASPFMQFSFLQKILIPLFSEEDILIHEHLIFNNIKNHLYK
jgi:hypothetical protein